MPLPQALGGSAASQQDRILDYYLNYNDPAKSPEAFYDTDQAAAERSVMAGGQSFSGARGGLLRRNQILQNLQLAAPILEARAGRASQQASQTQSERAALERAVLAGQQAEELERMRQRGQLTSQTQAEAARNREIILAGQQAQQRLETEGMQTAQRQATGIAADLVRAREEQEAALTRAKLGEENANWRAQLGVSAGYNRDNLGRSFAASQAEADRANNLSVAKFKMSNSGYSDAATQDVINSIIRDNSGFTTGNSGTTRNFSLIGSSVGLPFDYMSSGGSGTTGSLTGSAQGPDEGTGEGTTPKPTYRFGVGSPRISNADWYDLTGGEDADLWGWEG